jgi:hypothetical protein
LKSKESFDPDSFLKSEYADYGIPIIKKDKTIIPSWDYITGTGGNAPFIKKGNKVTMVDTWDIHPFSRNKKLPKFLRNFNANIILGGKDFTLHQSYKYHPEGIKQLLKLGGKINK